ncbi:hypothetical protein XH84_01520 [Bradyrhizobium nanningense]|nr:hypothetical protein XH84_01520 [Bradyrhizobium nanningense]
MVRQRIDGLVVGADGLTQMYQQKIVEWVAGTVILAISQSDADSAGDSHGDGNDSVRPSSPS